MSDRDLVERWVCVWAHTRRMPVRRVDGWPLVHVRTTTRRQELVCVEPDDAELANLARHAAGDHRAMLTVIARDRARLVSRTVPPGLRVDRDDETLMTTTLGSPPVPPAGPGLRPRWTATENGFRYSLEAGDTIAAEGTVGVLGHDAVLDAVSTHSGFRRQGLGRHVVLAMTAWAAQSGAGVGFLAASAEGRALYRSLGWDDVAAMWSMMGTDQR